MAESTIVVALDTSELSEGTIPYAVTLAKATNSRLSFVTVWEGAERALIESLPDLADDLFKRGEKYYEEYLKDIAKRVLEQGVKTEAEVRTGDAAEEIVAVARERKARMIALASHGRSGISRWMAGSVASELIRESPVPALIVGPHALEQGPGAGAIRRLLVPLDGSEMAETALPLAAELAVALDAEVYLAQSLRFVTQAFMFGVPEVTIENVDQQIEEAAKEYLTKTKAKLPQGVTAKTAVVRGLPAESLIDLIAERDIDLVVMATHARGGLAKLAFGSVADRMIHGKAPVLLVRGEETE
jgi:nucleotide-binding universal stress UspA family protein